MPNYFQSDADKCCDKENASFESEDGNVNETVETESFYSDNMAEGFEADSSHCEE